MKVLFVIPDYVNIWESLGIGYIAAYCKANYQGELKLKCLHTRFSTIQDVVEEGIKSDVVAFTTTTPTHQAAISIAREIKAKNKSVQIVFGGYHVSSLNEHEEVIDFAVRGEGEIPFVRILEGDGQWESMIRPSFDELPWPDRDLIYNDRMVDFCQEMCGQRITSFQSRRVCPFRCTMCGERNITGAFHRVKNPIRVRDPKDLLDEIEFVACKYQLTGFKFVDATWNTSLDDVIGFCEEKIRRGFKLPWEVMVHAGLMKKEMLAWMALANCRQINVGCESGSPRVLKDMRKGLTVEKIIQTFDWAKEYGIQRRAFFMIGMPNETRGDIELTDKLIERIEPDVVGITILCPYPGTDFYRDEFKDLDWSRADEYSNDFWSTEHSTNKELKAMQRYFSKKYENILAWHQTIV